MKQFHYKWCKINREQLDDRRIITRWNTIESGERKCRDGIPEKFVYIDNCRKYNNQIHDGIKNPEIALNITLQVF